MIVSGDVIAVVAIGTALVSFSGSVLGSWMNTRIYRTQINGDMIRLHDAIKHERQLRESGDLRIDQRLEDCKTSHKPGE